MACLLALQLYCQEHNAHLFLPAQPLTITKGFAVASQTKDLMRTAAVTQAAFKNML
jgi:hypothetical protein